MNYELAKKLKDAGFTQEGDFAFGRFWKQPENINVYYRFPRDSEELHDALDICIDPTLSELIEACGVDFYKLVQIEEGEYSGKWHAYSYSGVDVFGSTPEEAVANLYLALNQK